jgi:hypothetical protein
MKSSFRRIVIPVEDLSETFQELCSLCDPFLIAPQFNIVIVPPFQTGKMNEHIVETMALICKNRLTFSSKLGVPFLEDNHIVFPVISQQKWFFEIQQKLTKRCGVISNNKYSPHVLIPWQIRNENVPAIDKLPKSLHVNINRLILDQPLPEGGFLSLSEFFFRHPNNDSKL